MIVTQQLKLKSDIVFKAFFSSKENEIFLKNFLETILGEKLEKIFLLIQTCKKARTIG